MAVQSTKGRGKTQTMRYPTFKKFYDRDKILKQIDELEGKKAKKEETQADRLIAYRNKKKAR